MNRYELVCVRCGAVQKTEPSYTCGSCGGSLDIVYDYDAIFQENSFADMASRRERGIWKYKNLLPVNPNVEPVTLGEGSTPLLRISNVPEDIGELNFYVKNESANPTLAFKDRPLSVALTAAKQLGMTEVVCASTGNTGVAASAYAARAGLRCTVYVPVTTPSEKLSAMEQYGVDLERVEGTFSDAYHTASRVAMEKGAFNLTSTYLNPYAVEGDKTVAYEIVEELGTVPEWIIIPIGAGPLLAGCFKGFKEMKRAGRINKLPRMIGVQAAGCAPIVTAYDAGEMKVQPWNGPPNTRASGIADPLTSYPEDGTRTLSIIRESGGMAFGIPDEDLLRYRRLLAQKAGILAELSSVTAVAALEKVMESGVARSGDTVISVVTGHGLKDMTVTK